MKVIINSRLQSKLHSFMTVLLVLSLAVMLAWLSVRYQIQMDWTESGRHTLSHASQEVLSRMAAPVEITAYARKDSNLRQAIERIVGRYQRLKSNMTLHFVNPDTVPDEVRNAGITVNGELMLRYQDRVEHVKTGTEEEFTNALERLARGSEHWLVFLEGHGERDPFGQASHDLELWTSQLVSRGFRIQPLNLASMQTIPDNTKILIITSPTTDFLPGEISLVVEYLLRGGNILWLVDPGNMHGMEPLADQLGIEIPSGVMIDYAGSLIGTKDPTIVVNTQSLYPDHAVTRGFNYTTFFPTMVPIKVKAEEKWNKSTLLTSAKHTWLETGVLEGEVEYNEDSDEIGPLEIAVGLERSVDNESGDTDTTSTIQQRIIVIGDGDFLSMLMSKERHTLILGDAMHSRSG